MRIIGIKFLSSDVLAHSVSPKYRHWEPKFPKGSRLQLFSPKTKLKGLLLSFSLDLINYGLFT